MYIIRADGNAKIGAGHLMRCLTIAEALAEQVKDRNQICFFCADEQSGDMVQAANFPVRVLGTDYREMEAELPEWERLLSAGEDTLCSEEETEHDPTILVDSYFVTAEYLERIGAYGKIYLLDDMQERSYPVDVVINYNAFAKEEVYRQLYKDEKTEYLIGSEYVPVRRQFWNREYKISKEVKHVLITTGGGDIDNIAGEILQTIYREGINFHVVTGRYNPHMEELKKLENACSGVSIYHDISDMSGLMQKCDLAVTAGGTTIYELAAIGVPFLCFSYAKNQEALTQYIGEKEIGGYLGAYHLEKKTVLRSAATLFAECCQGYDIRKFYHEKEREMIDGKGAIRLAKKME